MAMIPGESLEMEYSDGGQPYPGSPHLLNGYSSSSSSSPHLQYSPNDPTAAHTVKTMGGREGDSARDSGVDISEGLHETKEYDHLSESRDNLNPQMMLHLSSHINSQGNHSVSENFCINPLVTGTRDMRRTCPTDLLPIQSQVSMGKRCENNSENGSGRPHHVVHSVVDESEMGRQHSVESESVSSGRTFSTIFEEESLTPEMPSTANTECGNNSNSSPQLPNCSDSDNEIYKPEEEELYHPENNDNILDPNPFDFDMSNSVINIDKSEVQFGPKYNIELMPSMPNVVSGMSGSPASEAPKGRNCSVPSGQETKVENSNSPTVHISITTPPVQSPAPQHYPIGKTQSTPTWSPSTLDCMEVRGTRRLPQQPLTLPLTSQMPTNGSGNVTLPMTPSSPVSALHISNGSVVLGPQIIINPCRQSEDSTPVSVNLEKILTDAQDKLALNYKQQTKTSFLPWLKGRQVIPMTEFYTESRILAVDKQGKQTRQTVDLVQTLMQDDETRFLVEGEPGMGKTLLAHKLSIDWAKKVSLQNFKFVFLIFLRDFKESLEDHVKEDLLPSLSDEKFKKVWEYCKNNEEQVLFILDGYDELEKSAEAKILKLIENRDFQRSKVVVTSRPDVLRTTAQKIIVKGFSDAQMFEFIGKYFKLVSEHSFGRNMKRIIEKDYKYRKLAKRPLFCVLLCMLYGSDVVSTLPEKLSDLMFKIMLCLIKWNNKKVGNLNETTEAFPPQYEELFLQFGKMCLQALKTDKTRFSEKEILDMKGMFDSKLLLNLGILSNDSENYFLGPRKFWKPVHKIFLEYLAGLYIANHISRECRDCKECREFSAIYRHEHVLQFVVGTLDKRAHLALDGRKHPIFLQMKDSELLMLLREAGSTKENCRAVAKLLDNDYATVYTSEVDFEGWSAILAQNFRKLKTLEIVWRIKSNNPDQESSFSEASPELYSAFFTALKSNTSIDKIKIRATQDGETFSEEKIDLFFSNLETILPKENLRELEIKELKMSVSSHLRKAIEGATYQMDKKVLADLEILQLDMYMKDEDLYVLCDRLKKCAPKLRELQLTGLVIDHRGFNSLVELLKKSKNLQKLHICIDKTHLHPNHGFCVSRDDNYTPSDMHRDQIRMLRQAGNESRRAYNEQKCCEKAKGPLNKESPDHPSASATAKVNHKTHRNSSASCVSENRSHLQSSSNNSGSANCKCNSPSGVLSDHVSFMSPENKRTHQERKFNTVKDPTKELSYLFQDPFNTGTKSNYKINHHYFIPGDGENQLPLPLCIDREHKSVFHNLFSALPESTIRSLTLDYPCLYLETHDLICLGDAIRKTKYLETLKLPNLKMAKKCIPVMLGLGQSQSLTTVVLESIRVVITDTSFALACTALRNNTTLKSLSLAGWEFSIQDKAMASRYFQDLLRNWKVTDLNLANCHIDIGAGMAIAPTLFTPPLLLPIHGPTRNWSSIKTLRLPNVKLKEPLGLERRGHLLLPVLRNCPNLTILDLSASSNHVSSLDDNATCMFFQLLGTSFKKLKELTLCNWEFKFKNYEETCSEVGHLVRSCTELKILVLDKVSEIRSGLSIRIPCRTTFLHHLVNNLPRLTELSLCWYRIDNFELDKEAAAHLGACFHDHWNSTNKFKLKFFGLPSIVETALHDSLKKDNFSVFIGQGHPVEITVKKPFFLSA